MSTSKIEWTESTWNPITGCTKISPGCQYCYAEKLSKRLMAMGQPNYRNGFQLTLQPHMLEKPLTWKKPQIILVNSMSDIFHKQVPIEYIHKIFDVIERASWHQFQLLTKRSKRMMELSPRLKWPANLWMGVSIENNDYTFRIDHLTQTQGKIKFLSIEPLLGPLPNLNLTNVDWAIVGGESGPNARPIEKTWVEDILKQCKKANVPFFFKQWGGKNKKKTGRSLNGKTWDELPFYQNEMIPSQKNLSEQHQGERQTLQVSL